MKTIIYNTLIVGLLFFLSACNKFTDITPKGKNLLSKVSDLESLLNFNFSKNGSLAAGSAAARTTGEDAFIFDDLNLLVGDIYPYPLQNVTNVITAATKSLDYIYLTGDQTIDRRSLVGTDIKYSKFYFIINNVANVIIANVDKAKGDAIRAKQIKAEAYVLRAYMHYLLVNIFAKAYDPSTAASDGGVPYVKEDNAIAEANLKSTVSEVYANIMADLDAAAALNSLPLTPVNNMRGGQAFYHAVKARVLMNLRRYPEALAAANASLQINSTMEDHRIYMPVGANAFAKTAVIAPDNIFYAAGLAQGPFYRTLSLEAIESFETGHIISQYVKPFSAGTSSGVVGALNWTSTAYTVNSGGFTTSDSYLIKAECLARAGAQQNIQGAIEIINMIRQRRIHASAYAPLTAITEAQAMAHLRKLSRSEFIFTVKNYLNYKRWNTEDAYKQTISRTINGTTYQLGPDSKLWILPFPQNATDYNPNLTQNY